MTKEENQETKWRKRALPMVIGDDYHIRGVEVEIKGAPWTLELHEWGWHAERDGFRTRAYRTAEQAISWVKQYWREEGIWKTFM